MKGNFMAIDNLLPDVKTLDLERPVDTRLEFAMLQAYEKGIKDGVEKFMGEVIDVEVKDVEDN